MNNRDEYIEKVTVGKRERLNGQILLEEYNPQWPKMFEREAEKIRNALGGRALNLHHVGSTAVPGLCAKPIIDIVLVVADSSDEPSYLPDLEAAGYTLRIREPDWLEHRLLKSSRTDINLHVFSENTSEIERMLAFRDWLRSRENDRQKYEQAKRKLARQTWKHIQHYADAKSAVIKEIMTRASMSDILPVLDRTVGLLKTVPGVKAIVLGGSRARGTHTADSDIDIGIYYDSEQLDLARLEIAASDLDDEHRENLIAPPGEWGEWVNGGGWLVIRGYHVDLLLRDIDRVANVIAECQDGIARPHYQTGHPHAFINAMYMGELAIGKMLWDLSGEATRMKAIAEIYPPKLKAAMIGFFTFEAEFSAMFAGHSAAKDDGYYVFAHLVRAVSCLNQILFAVMAGGFTGYVPEWFCYRSRYSKSIESG